ncbi:MAG: Lipoprotein-releasing system ATP-binding protein LolD [Elusimicrobia bacterium]|nr:Lipoprotein-releasing system ATP-binding protein LolD [Elusimicrobiota bacterium]
MKPLQITNLKKSFVSPDGETHQIIDVPSFSLNEKEQIALEGGSGTGKTTFLNLIAGILRADEGSILVSGEEIADESEARRDHLRALNIGYVFQVFNLLQGLTALQNVELGMMFGKGVDPLRAKSLLKRVGLEKRMNHQPRQLSVGQQQRVAVARALANHPRIVLADEPTGNLDSHNAKEALGLIRQICQENGAALLVVSHDHSILSQFERVDKLEKINRAARP